MVQVSIALTNVNMPATADGWLANIHTPTDSYYPSYEQINGMGGIQPIASPIHFGFQFDWTTPIDVPEYSLLEISAYVGASRPWPIQSIEITSDLVGDFVYDWTTNSFAETSLPTASSKTWLWIIAGIAAVGLIAGTSTGKIKWS